MKNIVFALVAVIASWAIGYISGVCRKNDKIVTSETLSDTVWVVDTIYEESPVEVTRWKYKTVHVPVKDTVVINDTVYVELPIDRVEYAGEYYKATVSGFKPVLESITVFPKTAYVTHESASRFSLGVSAGPGLFFDGSSVRGGVGIVAGLQIKL